MKRAHLNTAQQCQEEGTNFIPICVDGAGGAWGDDAERVWAGLEHAIAAATGDEVSSVTADLDQSLSIILHREGARAVLLRVPGAKGSPCQQPSCGACRPRVRARGC